MFDTPLLDWYHLSDILGRRAASILTVLFPHINRTDHASTEEVEDEPALVQLASEMFIYKGTPIHREMEAQGVLGWTGTSLRYSTG